MGFLKDRSEKVAGRVGLSALAMVCGCGVARTPTTPPKPVASRTTPVVHIDKLQVAEVREQSEAHAPREAEPERQPPPEVRDPMAQLPVDSEIRQQAVQFLATSAKAEPQAKMEVMRASYYAALDAAIVEYQLLYPDGMERRFFGLISPKPDAHVTLEMQPPSCGELEPELFDIRGDGVQHALFTGVGGGHHCHLAGTNVAYRIVGERWVEETQLPEAPYRPTEVNGDSVPDFPIALLTFNFGACTYAGCSDYYWRVDVTSYESWDGKRFSRGPRYRRFYQQQFEALLQASADLLPADPSQCERQRINDGALSFAYAILAGKSRAQALRLARVYFEDVEPKACEEIGPVHTLKQIEQDLIAAETKLRHLR